MSRNELTAPTFYGLSSATSSVFDIPTYNDSYGQRITPTPSDRRSPFDLNADDDGESTPILVISGGTGCNSICSAFGRRACYVLPVSDNGGSSAEIIRVLGARVFAPSSALFNSCRRAIHRSVLVAASVVLVFRPVAQGTYAAVLSVSFLTRRRPHPWARFARCSPTAFRHPCLRMRLARNGARSSRDTASSGRASHLTAKRPFEARTCPCPECH